MKVCPVCNESFTNDLRFCELDGVRLKRQHDDVRADGQNRMWSVLGVGVLLGALVIAALSIVFTPRSRPAPAINPPEATNLPPVAPSDDNQPLVAQTPSVATDSQPATGDTASLELKKKDKTLETTNSNLRDPALNPKAAAQGAEDEAKPTPAEDTTVAAQPEPKKLDHTAPTKAVNDQGEPNGSLKPAQTSAEVKKDKKTSSKESEKEPENKKKTEDKDKKKKGGFLRVFKKIFGKD